MLIFPFRLLFSSPIFLFGSVLNLWQNHFKSVLSHFQCISNYFSCSVFILFSHISFSFNDGCVTVSSVRIWFPFFVIFWFSFGFRLFFKHFHLVLLLICNRIILNRCFLFVLHFVLHNYFSCSVFVLFAQIFILFLKGFCSVIILLKLFFQTFKTLQLLSSSKLYTYSDNLLWSFSKFVETFPFQQVRLKLVIPDLSGYSDNLFQFISNYFSC